MKNAHANILYNGGILIIPILLASLGLWEYLPTAYSQENFSRNIPNTLVLFENVFRILVFVIPVLLLYGVGNRTQIWGWFLYVIGFALYVCSYLAQIVFSFSTWSTSFIGFSAPAWTTIFWMYGIALICTKSWLFRKWRSYIYIMVATVFVILHTYHTFLVYSQLAHANNA
jgi:hypothetical protein